MNTRKRLMQSGTKRGKLFTAILCLIYMTLLFIPAAYAADSAEVNLKISQVFTNTGTTAPPDNTFNYILTPKAADNPMPAGATENGYRFKVSGTRDINIGPIVFTQMGVYIYELRHVTASQPKYTYDREVYTLEIYVDNNMTAVVVVYKENGSKAAGIKYRHSYEKPLLPSDPESMADPPVVKTVSGNPTVSGVFTFTLKAQDSSQPMPAGSVNGVKTVQITGSGRAEFGTWSYSAAGTYYYYVSEVNDGLSGYNYDTAVYTITDSVKDVDGQLAVTRIVTNSSNRQVASMSFINTYTSGGGYVPTTEKPTVKPTVKPTEKPIEKPTETPIEKETAPTEPTIPELTQPTYDYPEPTEPERTTSPERETIAPTQPLLSAESTSAVPITTPEVMTDEYGNPIDPNNPFGNLNLGDDDPEGSKNNSSNNYNNSNGNAGNIGNNGNTGKENPKTGDESRIELYAVLFLASCVTAMGSIVYLLTGKKRGKARR